MLKRHINITIGNLMYRRRFWFVLILHFPLLERACNITKNFKIEIKPIKV